MRVHGQKLDFSPPTRHPSLARGLAMAGTETIGQSAPRREGGLSDFRASCFASERASITDINRDPASGRRLPGFHKSALDGLSVPPGEGRPGRRRLLMEERILCFFFHIFKEK